MVTMAADAVFVDTNVLVYANVAEAPLHAIAYARLTSLAQTGRQLWISRQVVREYLATLTRPGLFAVGQPKETVINSVIALQQAFYIAEDGPGVTQHLLQLMRTTHIGGRQIHDANIVATMLAHGIRRLLTHNTGDFARFADQIEVMPLQ